MRSNQVNAYDNKWFKRLIIIIILDIIMFIILIYTNQ